VRWSILIVAALVAIGIAATVDVLRDGGSAAPPTEPTVTRETRQAPSPEEALRAAGVSGQLYFTVYARDGCAIYMVELPDMQDVEQIGLDRCSFDVSSQGDVVAGAPCPQRGVQVHFGDGSSSVFRGCAPAWRPDDALTLVRRGDVVTGKEILVEDVARFARNAIGRGRLEVRQLAWLSDTRLAVLIGARAVDHAVVIVLEDDRVVSEPIFADRQDALDVLRHSQEVFVGGEFGSQIFDSQGNFVSASRFPFPDLAAVAEFPGGRWFAVARPGSVCIYEETEPPPREYFPITCLDADAVDLAWR
jgi:hypothetical protein